MARISDNHDSRDSAFTASRGGFSSVNAVFYAKGIGSETDFQSYRGQSFWYFPVGERLVAGVRADIRAANGSIPFYGLPNIELRGIGAARYQDMRAAVVETGLRWKLDESWSVLGFAGGGNTWGRRGGLGGGATRSAQRAGFRCLIARQQGSGMAHTAGSRRWIVTASPIDS